MTSRWITMLTLALALALALTAAGCGPGDGGDGDGGGVEATGSADGDADTDAGPPPEWAIALAAHLSDPPHAYVGIYGTNGKLADIDSASDKVVETVPVGKWVSEVSIKPDGSEVYVCAPDGNQVYVVDPATRKVKRTVKTADGPYTVAFLPDGSRYLLSHSRGSYVTVHDAASDKELQRIEVGKHPTTVRVNFQNTLAYVGHGDTMPSMEDLMSGRVTEFAMSEGAAFIDVIDIESMSVTDKIETLGNGVGITWRPDGKIVYATARHVDYEAIKGGIPADPDDLKTMGEAEVVVIDVAAGEVIERFDLSALDVAFHPDGRKVYALLADKVVVIDGVEHEQTGSIPIQLGG